MSTATAEVLSPEEKAAVQQVRDRKQKLPLMEQIKKNCPPGSTPLPPPKYRLLSGVHIDDDVRTGRERTWVFDDPSNNVVESYKKLDQPPYSPAGYPPKFESIDGGPQASTSPYNALPGETKEQYFKRLSEMVAKQLEAFEQQSSGMFLSAEPGGTSSQPSSQGSQGMQTPGKPIEQMTEPELRQLAKDEGVDLKSFKGSRDQLLGRVKSKLGV